MRPLKVLTVALAMSLLAAPAIVEARPAKPPAAAKAKAHGKAKGKGNPEKREERVRQALENQGIDSARAKQVVEVIKKYRTERTIVQADMKKHRESLRALLESKSTDEAAYKAALDGIDADRKKMVDIQTRQVAEIRGILKPSEQAKVMKLLHRAKQQRGQA